MNFGNRLFASAMAFAGMLLCAAPASSSYAQSAPSGFGPPPAVPQITQPVNPAQYTAMTSNVRPEIGTTAIDQGRVDDNLRLSKMLLLLHRPDAQEQALDEFMAEQTTPGSANYHHWLTIQQIATYGPAQSDINTLTSWLQSQGFTVDSVNGDGMGIYFSGTAGQVRAAFKSEIHNVNVDGAEHIANITTPQIPSALTPAVIGIVSLNDFKPHTNFKPKPDYTFTNTNGTFYALVPADLQKIYNITPLLTATPTAVNGAGQTIVLLEEEDPYNSSGSPVSNPDVTTFRSTFGLPTLNSAGKPTYREVHPGGCTDPGDLNDGTDSEVELDIEWAGASAPNANLVMASCSDTTTYGVLNAANGLNSANDSARLWSISYGLCEASNGATANAAFSTTYQSAAARGVSVFVASGDQNAASCDAGQGVTAATHGIAVSGWTDTAYNVSVGGTDFGDTYAKDNGTYWETTNTSTYGSAKSYINEIPWNDSCASVLLATYISGSGTTYGSTGFCNTTTASNDGLLTVAGGSGGPSNCSTGSPAIGSGSGGSCVGRIKPTFQSVLGNPTDNVRDIPDISLFAANGIWGHYYVFCFSNPNDGGTACTNGNPSVWSGAGGTSFASPIMAGIQALVNQQNSATGTGNPNSTYYSLAATEYGASGSSSCNSSNGNAVGASCIFYDVTQGDMDVNCTGTHSCYRPSGTNGVLSTSTTAYQPAYGTTTAIYSGGAAKGWDFATGIGTVNACNLVNNWTGTPGSLSCNGKQNQTITFPNPGPLTYSPSGTFALTATASSGLTVTYTSTTTGVCTISGSTATIVAAGTCTINADQAGNATYNAAPTVTDNITINKANQTITFTSTAPAGAVVGGTTYTVTATSSAGLTPVTFTIDAASSGVCTIAGSTVSFTGVGTCTIDANQAGNTNYNAATQTQQSFSVGKGSQTITFTSTAPAGAVVGGATYMVTATSSAGLTPVTFTIDAASSGVCTIAGSTVSFTGVGTCTIDANQAGNANYNAATQTQQSFSVGKGSQTITFPNPGAQTYSASGTFAVSATATSGLAVTFTSTTPGVCTVAGSTVTIVSAGTCSINADQAGDTNYNAAPTVSDNIAINAASQTIAFPNPGAQTYSPSGTFAVGATATSGLTVTFTSTTPGVCTVAGSTVTIVSAGTCSINADQSGNANYSAAPTVTDGITINPAGQTITFTSTPPGSATVGGPTYTVTATGGASGNPVTFTIDASSSGVCTIAGSTVSFVGTGTCLIDANQTGNTDYAAAPQAQQAVSVGVASQTITFPNPGPVAYSPSGTFALNATGGASGNPVTYVSNTTGVCTVAGSTATIVSAGTCSITASQAGNASYGAATPVTDLVTINPAGQTITFTTTPPASPTYGGSYAVGASGGASGNPVTFSIDGSSTAGACSIVGNTVSFTGTGSCVVDANQAGNANYTAASQQQQSFTIGTANQAITFTSPPPSPAVLGQPAYMVTATASSTLPVTLSIDAGSASVCALSGSASGSTVTYIGTGTCTIDANQAGDANYNPAPQAQQAFTVGLGTVALVFTTQPVDVAQGGTQGTLVVSEQNQYGYVVSSDSSSVVDFTVSSCGGTSLGSATMTNGVATLSNSALRFYTANPNPQPTVSASSTGTFTGNVTSNTFNVTANVNLIFSDGFESCRP